MALRADRIPLPPSSGNASMDIWMRRVTESLADVIHYRKEVSSNYSVRPVDQFVQATTGGLVVTLESGKGLEGRVVHVKNSAVSTIDVNVLGGGTIDSTATVTLKQFDCISVLSDGTNWIIF